MRWAHVDLFTGLFRLDPRGRKSRGAARGLRMELRRKREITMTNTMHLLRCRPALAFLAGARAPQAAVQHHRCSSSVGGGGSSSSIDGRSSASVSEEELQRARAWLAALHADVIPLKTIGELSFSRSSGPGGQNVNK